MDGHMNVELKNLSLFWVSAFSCVKYADFRSLKWWLKYTCTNYG